MARFNKESYIKKRRQYKLYGGIAVFIALFNMMDAGYPFPIPLTGGIAIYVSLFILIPGAVVLLMGLWPPSTRTIEQVAKVTNGYILSTFLVEYLNISTKMAEAKIYDLFMEGYLDVANKVDNHTPVPQWVCKFVGVVKTSETSTQQPGANRRDPNFNLGEYTEGNPEMTVDDINNMLLSGSMNLGASGQPV